MSTTLVEAVGAYLQAQAQGTLGTDLFIGLMPSAPDTCAAVYEDEGGEPLLTAGAAATAVELVSLRVIVRAGRDDYAVARDKALAIRALLGALTDTTLSGVRVLRCTALGWAQPYGEDESDRPHFLVRFRAHVEP